MSSSFYKGLLFAALVLLFHAAYSVTEWRHYMRGKTSADGSTANFLPPSDIVVQTLVSLVLAMFCVLRIAEDFKEIRATVELSQKSWENMRNRPSFYLFNHRGKAFSPDYVPPSSGGRSNTEIPDRFLS